MKFDPNHIAWCQRLMASLRDGGTWGVPRSGLQYHKRGNALVLVTRLPHMPEMPMTVEELASYQEEDHTFNVAYFGEAGFEVLDETVMPPAPDGQHRTRPLP